MMQPSRDISRLIEIMAALRDPETGCAWDLAQDFSSLAPYALEEAYEVVDAIQRGDLGDLREELGDLLLQVVFHAQLGQELREQEPGSALKARGFDFGDVVEAICTKLIRRHPHIFGEEKNLSPEAVKAQWSQIKAQEKALRGERPNGLLSDVPLALPGLTRAVKLQEKASKVGFDWNDARAVIAKIREETDEIAHALEHEGPQAVAEEIGDLLFVVANLARHAHVDPEAAIRAGNAKFERRFAHIEKTLALKGRSLNAASLDEMEALWVEAKQAEKQPS